MTVSLDILGCYSEHKEFFDAFAVAMQAKGHKIGIITGERERDPYTKEDNREKLKQQLGFVPDFMHLWGEYETITNGALWKAEKMVQEGVALHFDDDAREIKRYTDLWVVKTLNPAEMEKF